MRLLSIFLLSAFSLAAAAELSDPMFDREIRAGIDFTLRQAYDSALAVADSLVRTVPDRPAGYFLRLSVLSARYFDRNDTSSLKKIYGTAEKVISLSENNPSPIRRYYHAATLGFLSVMEAKEGNLLSSALKGRRAAREFEAMLHEGASSGDALGILGSYHYWASAALKGFSWLPFIEDRRDQGISELSRGVKTARYMRFALVHSLLWCCYDNHRYAEALALCDSALAQYPSHSLFLETRMHILYKLKRYPEALKAGLELDDFYKGREEVPVNLLMIRCKLALIHYSMGERAKGKAIAEELLARDYDAYFRQKVKKDLYYLEEARKANP